MAAESAYDDGRGRAVVKRVSSQLLTTVIHGASSAAMVHWYIREFHAFVDVAPRKVDIFHDWGKITSLDPDARKVFTVWAEERRELNRRASRGVHTLVESTLLFLALEASGAFSRANYRHAYRDRRAFERELDKCTRSPSTDAIERG